MKVTRKLYLFFWGTFCSNLLAGGTASTPTYPTGLCTKDINPWGRPSMCICEEGMKYDQRVALCLPEDMELPPIQIRGKIIAPMASIGGETSDFVLEESGSAKQYDLVLSLKDREEIAKYGDREIEIKGEAITLPGVERDDRPGIIVEQFHDPSALL